MADETPTPTTAEPAPTAPVESPTPAASPTPDAATVAAAAPDAAPSAAEPESPPPATPEAPAEDDDAPSPTERRLVAGWLLLTPFVAAFFVVVILGALDLGVCTKEGIPTGTEHASFFGFDYRRGTCGQYLFLLSACAGALGSSIHALTSFASYHGNQALRRSWFFWYLARAPVGAALAAVTYFVYRGGMMPGVEAQAALSPYAVGAVSVLAGMFSKQAVDKLREVFDALFKTKGDQERKHGIAKKEDE